MNLTIPDFLEAATKRNSSKPLLEFRGERLTYSEINDRSSRLARSMQEMGVKKGCRIAVKLMNSTEFILTWFAASKIGAILVPINPKFKEIETLQIIAHSNPSLIVSTHRLFQQKGKPDHRVIFANEGGNFHDLISGQTRYRRARILPLDPSVIIYTSGTTGTAKGVVQSHRSYVITGEAFSHWLGLGKEDRILTSLPLSHINAQAYSMMGTIGSESTLILLERFSLKSFWSEVAAARATQFNTVGAMLMLIYKRSERSAEHNVRVVYSAPTLPETIRSELEHSYNIRIVFGYGLSECTFGFIEKPGEPRRPGSIGKPRDHPRFPNKVYISDEHGKEVRRGKVGQILLQNAAMMNGYYKDRDKTNLAMKDGWLHTGDLGFEDSDGYFYFVDRMSDIIRRKGENISSYELEHVASSHPGVIESAAIGIPSELSDEEVVMFVTTRPELAVSERDIKEWCEERLASFKVPSRVFIIKSLPRTPTFRIAKNQLFDLATSLLS